MDSSLGEVQGSGFRPKAFGMNFQHMYVPRLVGQTMSTCSASAGLRVESLVSEE